MQKRQYFGTDGIRGQVGKSLINPEFMLKLGWAAGRILANQKHAKVIIGKDTRISGSMLESALEAGFAAAGVEVFLLGVLPTPGVAYLTHSLRAQAGVVISASHNPYHDNGIKFFDSNGKKLSDQMELDIENALEDPFQTVPSKELGKISQLLDASGRYIEFCKSIFPTQLTLHGLKIVVDCANGAGYFVAPRIFHELGAEVIAINNNPNGININKECGATDVRELQKVVVHQEADVGIALDGDGDRLMMVDHLGERIDGDQMLCILAQDGAAGIQGQGIVGTVMSNLGLEQALGAHGIDFARANVGDRYVLEELSKRDWTLGGEASGHIVNLNYTTTGDGIITALQLLRVLKETAKNLHELKQTMVKRPQVLINVPVFGSKDIAQYPKIKKAIAETEAAFNGEGRVLLRPSGTEPCVRVMVEGNDEGQVREVAESLASLVESEMS